jgi:hypothetical protein
LEYFTGRFTKIDQQGFEMNQLMEQHLICRSIGDTFKRRKIYGFLEMAAAIQEL